MWHNEDDLIKDLIFLNDFGNSKDKESYKILCSKVRGTNLKKKLDYPESFVDSRTGEIINLNDINFDTVDIVPKKGRGRGNMSKSLSKTKLQLQKQLRMARPLGSGDHMIETYCKRNKPPDNFSNTEESLSSENNKTKKNESENKILFYQSAPRIKAIRNSSIQSNALMQGLLAKTVGDNHLEQNAEKYVNSNGKYYMEKSKVLLEKKEESTKKRKETDSVERIINVPMETSGKSYNSIESFSNNYNYNFNLIYDYEEESDLSCFSDCSEELNAKNENTPSDSCNVSSGSSSPALNRNYNELYKKLGEKLNRFDRINKNTIGRGNYDLSNPVQCISPVDLGHEFIIEELVESQKNSNFFVLNEKDFPSLKRK